VEQDVVVHLLILVIARECIMKNIQIAFIFGESKEFSMAMKINLHETTIYV
jgi:hypothetical protein